MVLRDGIPVESLSPDEVYEEAVLLRAGAIIQGKLQDNLLMGRDCATDALWSALDEVGIGPTVRGLADGMETALGAAGQPLSESQVIDMQVARALLVKPRLIVVDGLLDGLSHPHRQRLLQSLCRRPATLVVLTEDAALAAECDRTLSLGGTP